ncbi:hypothetical protein JTE88_06175 [Arcanobacterium phocisimile]|uniref:Flp pilus-assembly TadE/G-like n=1 Tax=Arcanobacterium phocisimile TaxID=1302235 RepID=A0ABX7IFE8_9ACTO|nr:hypothetical protein [Arcanobacterium phocisimile]QRV01682.1 hypothetical protein JTE88_06175 [Arcanobacterium phocisimile]
MRRDRNRKAQNRREAGNLLILGLGIWVFVIALVLVIGAGVNLHNHHKDLLAHADAYALSTAQQISDAQYYGTGRVAYDAQALAMSTYEMIRPQSADDRVKMIDVVDTNVVVVELCRRVDITLLPAFGNFVKSVEMCATSSARLEIAPGE